ncbi:MAG: hypothetical protein KatS3mg100_402 [Candidatus Parcubacteria bacterium]|nr:MAG: hypothetical protein KatS3mg100_402 [Candidatus Parcubacteria bacterium]
MKPKQFVESLARAALLQLERGEELSAVLSGMQNYLTRTHRTALLRFALRALRAQAVGRARRQTAQLTIARPGDAAKARAESRAYLTRWGAPESTPVEAIIDPTLIGGWRLVWRDRMVDASRRRAVLALYGALRNAARYDHN